MAKIVFLTLDGGGNVSPALLIADKVAANGHQVCFLGHSQQAEQITKAGFRFGAYRHARPFSAVSHAPGLRSTLSWIPVFNDHGPGRDLADFVAREGADLVVIDCLLGGAFAEAQKIGLPTVMLMHTFIRFWTTQWRGPLGLISRFTGSNQLAADTVSIIVTTLPALDPIAASKGISAERVSQIGPVLPPHSATARRRSSAERPRVLVSLSTISQPGQHELLQRLLDAVADLRVDVTVTTGPAIAPESLRAPENAQLERFVSHSEVMPTMDLVVGHGGHGTTMLALAHGIPLVMIPLSPMIDQPMVARAVQDAGAGISLPMKASVEQLRAAIAGVLDDSAARAAAEALGELIRATNGAQAAADELETLVTVGAPADSGKGGRR